MLGCGVTNVKGLVFRARAGLVERHEAREAPCEEIRAELALARRGGLRRGRLRHHLKACPDCAAYLEDVRRQRRMLALVLPVVPTAALKPGLLASLGLGGGAAAGGLAAAGTAGTAATVAVAAVIGGAGLAGHGPLSADPPEGRCGSSPPTGSQPSPRRALADPAENGPSTVLAGASVGGSRSVRRPRPQGPDSEADRAAAQVDAAAPGIVAGPKRRRPQSR